MNGYARRVAKLEVLAVLAVEKPTWVAAIEQMADEDPAAFALMRVVVLRMMRRELAATGQVASSPGDYWDDPRTAAELDRLGALGWDAWLVEGLVLPVVPGWDVDEADFHRREFERTAEDAADAHDHLVRLGWRQA